MEHKEWKFKGPVVEGLYDQPTHCYFCKSKYFEGICRKLIFPIVDKESDLNSWSVRQAIPAEPFVRWICDPCWDFRKKTWRGYMFDSEGFPGSELFRQIARRAKSSYVYPKCHYCKNNAYLYKPRKKTYNCWWHL